MPSFPVLVDLGSTHCFVDPSFANMNTLPHYSVSLMVLHLFDGTTTTIITEATDLPIHFHSGDVTLLDSDCKIVLGHNWLTRYNPLIDWVLSSIEFRTSMQQVLVICTGQPLGIRGPTCTHTHKYPYLCTHGYPLSWVPSTGVWVHTHHCHCCPSSVVVVVMPWHGHQRHGGIVILSIMRWPLVVVNIMHRASTLCHALMCR